MRLVLGVIDVPYTTHVPTQAKRVAVRRGKKPVRVSAPPSGGQTTGDVAEILEQHYHVMQTFFDIHQNEIVDALVEDMEDELHAMITSGGGRNSQPFVAATSEIKRLFTQTINSRELDGRIPGVPTQSSLAGVSHRFKHPTAKGHPVRPSFRDTGLYLSSFVAQVEE